LLQGVDLFDAAAFNVTDSEAALMDPQQRLVLESVAEVLGAASGGASPSSCGVFVGVSSQDYAKLSTSHTGVTAYTGTGTAGSVISGRISYTFGLQGPALTIDTACSSSLAGVHMAFNSLLLGQCGAAAGAGVNLLLHPETLAILQKAGMLAPDGRCKTLNTAADGYARAEAVGTLLLQAGGVRAADCLALVAGSAVNQDGRSSSLTAPNGPAQQAVVRAALQAAQLPAAQLSALQMHGTGTPLGDPIEVGAASAVLVDGGRDAPLVLMASKSWMGHAEPGAGVAGLAHAQVALTQGLQLPILHLGGVNHYVEGTMGKHASDWAAPRQAAALPAPNAVGTSAFAFQGTNAHVVLQSVATLVPGAPANTSPLDGGGAAYKRQRTWLAPPPHGWDCACGCIVSHPFLRIITACTLEPSYMPPPSTFPSPLLRRMLHSVRWAAQAQHVLFACNLASAPLAYLWAHRVSGRALLPGAGFFELAAAAAATLCAGQRAGVALLGASIPAPLVLPPPAGTRQPAGVLQVILSTAAGRVEVASPPVNGGGPSVHLAADVSAQAPAARAGVAPRAVRKALLTAAQLAGTPAAAGPAAYAAVAPPTHDNSAAHVVSPAALDNCLQLGAATPRLDGRLMVPAGLKAFTIPCRQPAKAGLHAVSQSGAEAAQQAATFTDYSLLSGSGSAACHIDALEARPLAGSAKRAAAAAAARAGELDERLLYQIDWLVHSAPGQAAAAAAAAALADGVQLSLSSGHAATVAAGTAAAQGAVVGGLHSLSLVTGGLQAGRSAQPMAADASAAVPAAGLWGLARTLAQELPSYKVAALDFANSSAGAARRPALVAAAPEKGSGGEEFLVDASPYGCSVQGAAMAVAALVPAAAKPSMPPFRLFPKPRGALQNLQPEVLPAAALAAGRVMVAVKAVGINFRDVLNVLGMYPGDPGPPGGDCAGVVVGVGAGVTHLQPGMLLRARGYPCGMTLTLLTT
jgi:3-oxoacyl-(acyl-carrier-protein) synthase